MLTPPSSTQNVCGQAVLRARRGANCGTLLQAAVQPRFRSIGLQSAFIVLPLCAQRQPDTVGTLKFVS